MEVGFCLTLVAKLLSTSLDLQAYRWVFYSSALVYGIVCLWDKPWVADIHLCWRGYPFHQVGLVFL